MTPEHWNVVISVATLAVLLAAAIAALVQLGHIRASNELNTFSEAFELWYSAPVQDGLAFINHGLEAKMQDPQFRHELDTAGPVDRGRHPELHVVDFIDNFAIYIVVGKMREDMIMHAAAQLIEHFWRILSPTIAIMRRQRGQQLYVSFEYLAYRARLWNARYPNGYVPKGFNRLPNPDVWRDADERADSSARSTAG